MTDDPNVPVGTDKCRCGWPKRGACEYCGETYPNTAREALRLVLLMAPHHQGDHSATGAEVAAFLGIDPPLTMPALGGIARKHGFNPAALWPWSTTA